MFDLRELSHDNHGCRFLNGKEIKIKEDWGLSRWRPVTKKWHVHHWIGEHADDFLLHLLLLSPLEMMKGKMKPPGEGQAMFTSNSFTIYIQYLGSPPFVSRL